MINELQGLSLGVMTLISGFVAHTRTKRANKKAFQLQQELHEERARAEGLVNGLNLWRQFSEQALLKIQEQDHQLNIAEADRARGEKAETENQHLKACLKKSRKEGMKLRKELSDLSVGSGGIAAKMVSL